MISWEIKIHGTSELKNDFITAQDKISWEIEEEGNGYSFKLLQSSREYQMVFIWKDCWKRVHVLSEEGDEKGREERDMEIEMFHINSIA